MGQAVNSLRGMLAMRHAISYSRLLCGSLLAIAFGGATASADAIGQVVLPDYKGATAIPDAATDPHPIKYQDQVQALDTVSTGESGATSLQFLDQSRFDVGPNATVKLDHFVFDPTSSTGGGEISMAVGAFRYVGGVMKNEEDIKLVTPTATMTIRGSEMVIYVGIDGTVEANIISGNATAFPCGNAEPVSVPAGQRVIVNVACAAAVTAARPLPQGFAALDVPGDLGDFATAAGGDEGGNDGADGGDHEGSDREKSPKKPERREPKPRDGGEGGPSDPPDGPDPDTF